MTRSHISEHRKTLSIPDASSGWLAARPLPPQHCTRAPSLQRPGGQRQHAPAPGVSLLRPRRGLLSRPEKHKKEECGLELSPQPHADIPTEATSFSLVRSWLFERSENPNYPMHAKFLFSYQNFSISHLFVIGCNALLFLLIWDKKEDKLIKSTHPMSLS